MTVELDGKHWKPVQGATVTAEQFIAARSLIHEVHQHALWSPWVMQDRAQEYDAAWETCGQWTSTEPRPPRKTLEESEAELQQRLAEADARFLAQEAQAEKDRTERTKHYDPDRSQTRLALLEEQGILADKIRQRDELLSGELFPHAPEKERRRLLASLEHDIAIKAKEVDDLLAVIGDPEKVADARGWLPAERRERALALFKSERGLKVRDLRARIAGAQTALKSLKGRSERAELREVLPAANRAGEPVTSSVVPLCLRRVQGLPRSAEPRPHRWAREHPAAPARRHARPVQGAARGSQ
jgi:hypothetical protein